MEVVLEDNDLKEFIDEDIPKPKTLDSKDLAEWKKCVGRARWVILEGVSDHIVSSLHRKETLHAMWKALKKNFQNNSDHRELALKDKHAKIKMEVGDSIQNYLTKFTHF